MLFTTGRAVTALSAESVVNLSNHYKNKSIVQEIESKKLKECQTEKLVFGSPSKFLCANMIRILDEVDASVW